MPATEMKIEPVKLSSMNNSSEKHVDLNHSQCLMHRTGEASELRQVLVIYVRPKQMIDCDAYCA